MSAEGTETNQFENVSGSVENASASPGMNASGSAENTVEGEAQLAQQLNQTVPAANGNVASAESANSPVNTPTPPVPVPVAPAAAVPVTTSGYVMSAKAKDLQQRRKALFKEMQEAYAEVFGDDKKAPKAKMYHAAGLLTIRERDGEDAYKAKLQEYIQANQGKYTTKTRKVGSPAAAAAPESVTGSPTVRSPVSAAESGKTIIRSIESMAAKVKEMVDTMVSTTKTLVKSDKSDMAAIAERVVRFANESGTTAKKPRKPRSNKGKTHKHKSNAPA